MSDRLPNGTQVKVREFTGKVINSYQSDDGTWHYELDTGGGPADWADLPEYVVEEIFTGFDACLYMDGNSDVFVFYTSDNRFRPLIVDGLRSSSINRYYYEDLKKPVKRLVKED